MDLYTTTDELFRVLRVRTPTTEQTAAATRVITETTIEINAYLDRPDTADPLTDDELLLCEAVCLDRAADIWRHTESIPGVMGPLDDTPVTGTAFTRYSFYRYARRLSSLKQQWGLA